MKNIDIVPLTKPYHSQAVQNLSLGFLSDPFMQALTEGMENPVEMHNWIFEGVVRHSLKHGNVYITRDAWGTACWLPPGKTSMSVWDALTTWNLLGEFMIKGWQVVFRFFAMQDIVEKYHRKLMGNRPHMYLWVIAAHPNHQRQGHGSSLLMPMLAKADREGLPCYLETATVANIDYYRRFGFNVADSANVKGVWTWFMIREPQ